MTANSLAALEITPALRRALDVVARGKCVQIASSSMQLAVLCGALESRGLVRTVKHRDHTRTYALTAAGRAARGQGAP